MSILLTDDGGAFGITASGRICDINGIDIAPEQAVPVESHAGPWNSNARQDGSWAGPTACAWCKATIRTGDSALEISHDICSACFDREVA